MKTPCCRDARSIRASAEEEERGLPFLGSVQRVWTGWTPGDKATWLILPEAICFVQGLSHASVRGHRLQWLICEWLLRPVTIDVIDVWCQASRLMALSWISLKTWWLIHDQEVSHAPSRAALWQRDGEEKMRSVPKMVDCNQLVSKTSAQQWAALARGEPSWIPKWRIIRRQGTVSSGVRSMPRLRPWLDQCLTCAWAQPSLSLIMRTSDLSALW